MVKKVLFGILFAIGVLVMLALGFFAGQTIRITGITKSLADDWQKGELAFIPGFASPGSHSTGDIASSGIEEELRAEYGDLVPEDMFPKSFSQEGEQLDSLYALLMTKTSVKIKVNGFFVREPVPVKVTVLGPDMPAILDQIFGASPDITAEELRAEIKDLLSSGSFPQRERVVEAELRNDENGYTPVDGEEILDALYGDTLSYYREALLREVPNLLGLEAEGGVR